MELIHLILSVEDFSWLRERPKIVRDFFEKKYNHPEIGAFLNQVGDMDHRAWTNKVDLSKKDYIQIKLATSKLFSFWISDASDSKSMPLWKWVFLCHDKEYPDFKFEDSLSQVVTDIENISEKALQRLIKHND